MGHAARQAGRIAGSGRWPGRIGLGLLLLASGCATVEDMFKPAPPPRPAAARPAPRPAARPARPPAAVPAPVQQAALPSPVEEVAVPALKGAPASRVEAVLGAPAVRQPNGAGERWSWRAQGCTLDLFLFPDVATGGLAVLDERGEGAPATECARLVAGARAR